MSTNYTTEEIQGEIKLAENTKSLEMSLYHGLAAIAKSLSNIEQHLAVIAEGMQKQDEYSGLEQSAKIWGSGK